MSHGYDDRWRGGRRGSRWLTIGFLKYHSGIQLYDLRGDVGARKLNSPTIQGQRKEALNRSLAALLGLRGNPMGKRCRVLNPSEVEPSAAMRLHGQVYGPTPPNRSQTCRSISKGGEWAQGLTTLWSEVLWNSNCRLLLRSGGRAWKYEVMLLVCPGWGAVCKS
jgi:hypothetical protein